METPTMYSHHGYPDAVFRISKKSWDNQVVTEVSYDDGKTWLDFARGTRDEFNAHFRLLGDRDA